MTGSRSSRGTRDLLSGGLVGEVTRAVAAEVGGTELPFARDTECDASREAVRWLRVGAPLRFASACTPPLGRREWPVRVHVP